MREQSAKNQSRKYREGSLSGNEKVRKGENFN